MAAGRARMRWALAFCFGVRSVWGHGKSGCHETAFHVDGPPDFKLPAGASCTIAYVSEESGRVSRAMSEVRISAVWALTPGLHVILGVTTATGSVDTILHGVNSSLTTLPHPGGGPPSISDFARLPSSLILLFSGLLDTGADELNSVLWHHRPSLDASVALCDSALLHHLVPHDLLEPVCSSSSMTSSSPRGRADVVGFSFTQRGGSHPHRSGTVRLLTCGSTTTASNSAPATINVHSPRPPGLHRTLHIHLSGLPSPPTHNLTLIFHLPQGAYMDTFELSERHDFHPLPRPPPILLNDTIDVELPATHSREHVLGLLISASDFSSCSLSMTLPIHVRYPAPTYNRTDPYAYVPVSRPVVLVDGEWVPVVVEEGGKGVVVLRVPAGEAWMTDVVRLVTVGSSMLGAVYLLVVLWRAEHGGRDGEEGEGQSDSGAAERRLGDMPRDTEAHAKGRRRMQADNAKAALGQDADSRQRSSTKKRR